MQSSTDWCVSSEIIIISSCLSGHFYFFNLFIMQDKVFTSTQKVVVKTFIISFSLAKSRSNNTKLTQLQPIFL